MLALRPRYAPQRVRTQPVAQPIIVAFGRRVKAVRMAAGLSQTELGRLSKMTSKFIGQIERGESNPSLATMVLVADALGADLADLIQTERRPSVMIPAEAMQRAQEALAVLGSVLATRKGLRSGRRR